LGREDKISTDDEEARDPAVHFIVITGIHGFLVNFFFCRVEVAKGFTT
jgi:hypothetical protein